MYLYKLISVKHSKAMIDQKSPQMFSTQLIDTSIEQVRNKKKTLVSKMDSVISLIRKVECEEKAAKLAKEEADQRRFDILVKVDERKQALIKAEETNNMLVRKVNVQKAILAANIEVLQSRMQHLLDDGDKSLGILDEMNRSLEMRLTSALLKKELAIRKKQESEAFSQVVLAYDYQMEKIVEESKRWKQEAVENSKLLEFLKDRSHVVDMLHGEITDECQDVNHLKEDMDQAIPPVVTEDDLIEKFALGVSMVTSLALAVRYPTVAAAPHILINGYKNALAIAVETKYSIPLAYKVKGYLADPSKFAMAAPVAPAAVAAAPAKEKEEPANESDDEMGFSLFD